jgi:glutamyl-tRNA reductase
MIETELDELERWSRSVELTPTIVALRERVRGLLRGELDKALPKLALPDSERKKLETMCEAMANKLLHGPLTELKQSQATGDGALLVEAVQKLFRLGETVDGGASEPSVRPLMPSVGGLQNVPAAQGEPQTVIADVRARDRRG